MIVGYLQRLWVRTALPKGFSTLICRLTSELGWDFMKAIEIMSIKKNSFPESVVESLKYFFNSGKRLVEIKLTVYDKHLCSFIEIWSFKNKPPDVPSSFSTILLVRS